MELGTSRSDAPAILDQRWVFVEDSEFLPAHGGGEREHLAMLHAARDAGVLAAVVIPVSGPIDRELYVAAVGGAPIVTVDRRQSAVRLIHPSHPYTVASRLPDASLVSKVRTVAPDATGIIVTSYKSWVIAAVLAKALELPAVLRMHNREGEYHRSLAAGTRGLRGLALRWEAARIERDECRLARAPWLSGVADISAADAKWRGSLGPVPVAHVPPFAGPDQEPIVRKPAAPSEVLFVGALDVATNVDAVKWLLEGVWPIVHSTRPDATLLIVGRSPSADVRRRVAGAPAARMHADVAEVAPFLARATVALNPAVSGSGVNIKLVEYLAAAVPVVSTSHATAGLELVDGRDLVIADRPHDFAAAVIDMLAEPERATAMGLQGAASIHQLLDPQAGLQKVAVLLQPRRR